MISRANSKIRSHFVNKTDQLSVYFGFNDIITVLVLTIKSFWSYMEIKIVTIIPNSVTSGKVIILQNLWKGFLFQGNEMKQEKFCFFAQEVPSLFTYAWNVFFLYCY